MQLTLPVYVERITDEQRHYYTARPVFFASESERDEREDRALRELGLRLQRELAKLAIDPDHSELIPLSWCPPHTGKNLTLRIAGRKRSVEGKVFAVVFESAGRRLVLVPKAERICFEWPQGVTLEERTQAVLTQQFRRLEKEAGELVSPELWLSGAQPHLAMLDISLTNDQRLEAESSSLLSLGGEKPVNGAEELEKTGRCLNRLYPNDLMRARLREAEVEQLSGWFTDLKGRRPMVVLVGKPGAGKTTVIHECLRRRLDRPDNEAQTRGQFHLISPQRVISGMSYLGQWEERWLAILTHMARRGDVLVLDDLPGLFEAGKSSGSELTLGHLLKARQEHDPVAILAEATPEAWGRLRETDRAFASMFHVIQVRETSDTDTMRILVRTVQELETETAATFGTDTVNAVLRLQRRFARGRAFPGKGVEMLRAMTRTLEFEETIDADAAVRWFADRHGIRLDMLDSTSELSREELETFFTRRIMGQRDAVNAMIDLTLTAKAQINDPSKPLGSILFLGPTGTGKTECARALAEFVFGGEDRMLRFDLNEYGGADAAARLIGGGGRSGQLTSRVQRQPFSLLLFDEVEKAHPDVFDLLLQVLGEGRLTDATGRTADFCNCLIILTSNLGAGTARRTLGFGTPSGMDSSAYREAAEKFFRPEFFNRIDRVAGFHELRQEDIEALATRLAEKALDRQGVRARRVKLKLSPEAVKVLARNGFDPKYGARALRRAVEEHLVEPLARMLSEMPDNALMEATVTFDDAGKLAVSGIGRAQAAQKVDLPPSLTTDQINDVLDEADMLAEDAAAWLDDWSPPEEDGLTEDRAWYFSLRDEVAAIRQEIARMEDALEDASQQRARALASRKPVASVVEHDALHILPREVLAGLMDRLAAEAWSPRALAKIAAQAVPADAIAARALRLLFRARRLTALCRKEYAQRRRWAVWRWGGVWLQAPKKKTGTAKKKEPQWLHELGRPLTWWPWQVQAEDEKALVWTVDAFGDPAWMASACGVRALVKDQQLIPFGLACGPLESDAFASPAALPPDSKFSTGEVTRLHWGDCVLDLRTGLFFRDYREESGEMLMALWFGSAPEGTG